MYSLMINITSDHPQTLQILLTSPAGTTLSLSEFNGAGGQNYTNTNFVYDISSFPSITTGSAPFSGNWTPQGGNFSVFDWESADGTWTITVIDTACANGGTGPGGTWTPGWFDGGAAAGGFSFGFNSPPPPQCWGSIPYGSETICAGGSANIQGYYESLGTGYSIYVTPWDGQAMSDPYAATEPGTYWIDAYDQWDGCWYFAEYELTVGSISLGPDQVIDQCGNDPIDLNALFNFGSITPAWTLNGAPVSGIAVSAATTPGVYQVTDAAGTDCSDTATVTVTFSDPIDLGADQSVGICAGSSLDLTTLYNTAGLSVEWQFGGAPIPAPIAATDAGTYTLMATSADGCSDLAEITVTVDQASDLGPDQNATFCSNATFDLTTLFSTTGLSTEWSYMMIPVNDPTSILLGGTYQLIVSPGTACADTAYAFITVDPAPVLEPDMFATVCEGEAEDITGYFTTTGTTESWTFGGAPVADPSAVTDAGIYTLIVTNAAGCSDTGSVDLEVVTPPVLGPDTSITICDGAGLDLSTVFATGSNSASWSLNGNVVADPGSVGEAGTYVLTATNPAGCSASATASIDILPSPELGADRTISICDGAVADLTSLYTTTDLAASWTLSGAPVADPAAVHLAGTYRLIAGDPSGCTDTAFVQLTVNAGPDLGPDRTFMLCPWQSVDLQTEFSTGMLDATYSFNGEPVPDPAAIDLAGQYLIVASDANGCSDTALANVIAIECMCVADLTENARCLQDPVQFNIVADSAIIGAEWNFNGAADNTSAIDPEVRFSSEGEIRVQLRATLTCGVIDVERTIRIEDCSDSCTVWIPSSFTPNGDGINEGWTWSGECDPEDFSMRIFDRFGELIFASNDPYQVWDGSYNGTESPIGVYAYKASYRLPYQDRREVAGSITLVR